MTERYQWEPSNDEIAARFGLDPGVVVRFDQNTAPTPPSWVSDVVATAADEINEYPDASYRRLRAAAAEFNDIDVEQIVGGAGLDELILLAAQAFIEPGDRSVMVDPTYSLHRIATLRVDGVAVEIPLTAPSFTVDAGELLDAAAGSSLTWMCVPNNPTGNRFDADLLGEVIGVTPGVTVLDAAYAEVADDNWSGWLDRFPRLIVMRTLSKGFALAGARVGYAMAQPELIDRFDGIRPPGSISSLSVELAVRALSDRDGMEARVAALRAERDRLFAELTEIGLGPIPSDANFILCPIGPSAGLVANALLAEGLVVRSYPEASSLGEYLRFTVRSPEEDARLVDALRRNLP
jgi:histidinol-phosphate aminotransferase